MRAVKALELFSVARSRTKLFLPVGSTMFGVGEYVWKNCCIGPKIRAWGILLQTEPVVWLCCFVASTARGFPAASQRKASRTKLAPDGRVEYGLNICFLKLPLVFVKSPAISAAV